MGIIKLVQALCAYTAGIFYGVTGDMQMSMLCFIVGVLCDIAIILEDKK